ncbi:retrovirus-related pol polyprotein from transposon TNT 1-94 [Tanacetum coccineum]
MLQIPSIDTFFQHKSKLRTQDQLHCTLRTFIQAKPIPENCTIDDDKFINIFINNRYKKDQGGSTSSRSIVDTSNMHTFYQHHPSAQRWTKDHPLEQVIGNPSESVRTRRQLETDGEMCMFQLTVSRTEPKNINEAWLILPAGLNQCRKNSIKFDRPMYGKLVEQTTCKNVINLKWLWKNKRDEENTIIRNKSRLVAKGYAQKEGIDFEESFAQLLGLELYDCSLRICTSNHLQCTKMDVKTAFSLRASDRKKCNDTGFELTAFSDSDHAGCLDSRKSTSGGIKQFLVVINYAQVLWMRTQLTDYGFHFDKIPMYCDSKAAIAISCNPVQHSRTKHIDVRYHFIKEQVEKGIVELFFVGTEYQLADLSYALSWKPCQGDSLNLPDHRYSIYTIKREETGGLDDIIMVNVIPPDCVDDVPVVEPNQHDDVSVVPEPIIEDKDEDPEEDKFEEEEDPQEEEDDMENNIEKMRMSRSTIILIRGDPS